MCIMFFPSPQEFRQDFPELFDGAKVRKFQKTSFDKLKKNSNII